MRNLRLFVPTVKVQRPYVRGIKFQPSALQRWLSSRVVLCPVRTVQPKDERQVRALTRMWWEMERASVTDHVGGSHGKPPLNPRECFQRLIGHK